MHNCVGKQDSSSAHVHGDANASAALGGLRKRTFDIVFASIALVVLAPMLLVTATLIRVLIGKSAIVAKQWIGSVSKRLKPTNSERPSKVPRIEDLRCSGATITVGPQASATRYKRLVSTSCRFYSMFCVET